MVAHLVVPVDGDDRSQTQSRDSNGQFHLFAAGRQPRKSGSLQKRAKSV
jgi:hypothetical protein